MREIKFRGFGTWGNCKQWWYGDLTHSVDGKVEIIVSRNDIRTHNYHVDKKSVGQYTGLKDKNGKEIYEGDVVVAVAEEKYLDRSITSDVVFNTNGGWQVRERPASDWTYEHGLAIEWGGWESIEVIGNIYENPELLTN